MYPLIAIKKYGGNVLRDTNGKPQLDTGIMGVDVLIVPNEEN